MPSVTVEALKHLEFIQVERRSLMEALGMSCGVIGMTFGIIAWGLIGNLRKEFEDLKKNLEDSGVLKDQTKSVNE